MHANARTTPRSREDIVRMVLKEGQTVKAAAAAFTVPEAAVRANQRWSMDFVTDRLETGGAFRILTLVDQYTRECPLLEPGVSLTARTVVACLERAVVERARPESITVDNGSEFAGRALDTPAAYADRCADLVFRHFPIFRAVRINYRFNLLYILLSITYKVLRAELTPLLRCRKLPPVRRLHEGPPSRVSVTAAASRFASINPLSPPYRKARGTRTSPLVAPSWDRT